MIDNNLRITGLASGIDTEEMINSLMKAERVKLDRVEQDKQILVWKQEMYNDINKDFANFILDTRKDFGLTSVSYTGAYISNSLDTLTWINTASSSNENAVGVSAQASAMPGTYDLNVTQLAKGVSLASSGEVELKNEGKNILEQLGLIGEENKIDFTIHTKNTDGNGVKFEFTEDGPDKITAIKENGGIVVKGNINKVTMQDIVKAINSPIKYKDGEEEKEISLGVRATYDSNIDRFFLQTTDTGEEASIKIDDSSTLTKEDGTTYSFVANNGNGSSILNLSCESGTKITGQDAVVNFQGAEGIKLSSNQFNINGLDFTIKAEGNSTITVSTDVDGVYEKISNFVEKYNEMLDKMSNLYTEKREINYKPLTSEQKKAMDKKDIELWEEKAKSGLLRSDDIIGRVIRNMRDWMYEKVKGVNGEYKRIIDIGISTEKYSRGTLGGKLVIDERKLKEAINKDANGVLELLFKEPAYKEEGLDGVNPYASESELTGEQIKTKRENSGIVPRLYDNIVCGMKDIIDKAGPGENENLYRNVSGNILIDFITKHKSISNIDKDVLDINKEIDDLNDYLVRKESYYYNKFTAMEKAISRMNQQSMWLSQQFNGQ